MDIGTEILGEIKSIYKAVEHEIDERLEEFSYIHRKESNEHIFKELCFCILSSGVGPKIAEKSVAALGIKLFTGSENELIELLTGTHKYPDKASYIYSTREYLKENFNLNLISKLKSINDFNERRDFIAANKGVRGIGYVQASHFLRNIGFSGYAILDKNILNTLFELGVTEDLKPPTSKKRYLDKEDKMRLFSEKLQISIDKLDLILWYRKTNRVPR
ncbi:MAG: hypothetical protein ACR2NW_02385 [Thermodesulfobacteriota bacterium]